MASLLLRESSVELQVSYKLAAKYMEHQIFSFPTAGELHLPVLALCHLDRQVSRLLLAIYYTSITKLLKVGLVSHYNNPAAVFAIYTAYPHLCNRLPVPFKEMAFFLHLNPFLQIYQAY